MAHAKDRGAQINGCAPARFSLKRAHLVVSLLYFGSCIHNSTHSSHWINDSHKNKNLLQFLGILDDWRIEG